MGCSRRNTVDPKQLHAGNAGCLNRRHCVAEGEEGIDDSGFFPGTSAWLVCFTVERTLARKFCLERAQRQTDHHCSPATVGRKWSRPILRVATASRLANKLGLSLAAAVA